MDDILDYESFKKKYEDAGYEIVIDGNTYQIPIFYFFDFIEQDKEKYNESLNHSTFSGDIPLNYFLYALKTFYENYILNKYAVNYIIKERIKEIEYSLKVDIQMLNKYLKTTDPFLKDTLVNETLKQAILGDIPDNFNNLQKAIYIYIKMCKLLTYDENYYASGQEGIPLLKHQDIHNISKISLTNNKVVCYEFTVLFAYFLNKIGINYQYFFSATNDKNKTLEQELNNTHHYGEGHMFLKFRYEKFLIKADATMYIFGGDLPKAKLNEPLEGLVCENTNEKTKEEFNNIKHDVYTFIGEKEKRITLNEIDKYETFSQVLEKYKSLNNIETISINEKISILIDKINSTNLKGIDAFSYLIQLKRILFTIEEQFNNIRISIIKSKNDNNDNPLAIITLLGCGEITRYIFEPGYPLLPISDSILRNNFLNNKMAYIREDDPKIPYFERGLK